MGGRGEEARRAALGPIEDMLLRGRDATVVDTGSMLAKTPTRAPGSSPATCGARYLHRRAADLPVRRHPRRSSRIRPPEVLPCSPRYPPTEAAVITNREIEAGADVLKLFTGRRSSVARCRRWMPP